MKTLRSYASDFLSVVEKEGRATEWFTSSIKISMAIILAMPGDTLSLASYASLRGMGISETFLAIVLFSCGALHMAALVVNGHYTRTPLWRGFCCLIGLAVFGILCYFSWVNDGMKTYGLLLGMFPVFILFELLGCRRAGADHKCLMPQ